MILTNNNNSGPGRKARKAMKQKTYYILAINYGDGYGVEFGAYDRQAIKEQMEHELCADVVYDMEIIKTTDNQPAIDAAINKLNEVK
jgi:hypothetical protein